MHLRAAIVQLSEKLGHHRRQDDEEKHHERDHGIDSKLARVAHSGRHAVGSWERHEVEAHHARVLHRRRRRLGPLHWERLQERREHLEEANPDFDAAHHPDLPAFSALFCLYFLLFPFFHLFHVFPKLLEHFFDEFQSQPCSQALEKCRLPVAVRILEKHSPAYDIVCDGRDYASRRPERDRIVLRVARARRALAARERIAGQTDAAHHPSVTLSTDIGSKARIWRALEDLRAFECEVRVYSFVF
mmetsp:Transcript_61401/g.144485  ORF Transcript_61401/g.144485 Transcript_61401/m.144485 type:complete len:245 (-) Transcript_61401:69-803(-)